MRAGEMCVFGGLGGAHAENSLPLDRRMVQGVAGFGATAANTKIGPVIPVGGGFGKIFSIGNQKFNGQTQLFWFATHQSPEFIGGRPPGGLPPDASDGGSWQLRFQLQMLFPR